MRRLALSAIFFLAGAMASAASAQGAAAVEVIPVRYRPAQELVPVIEPLVGAGGSVSAYDGRLIVRAAPSRLEEIKRLVDQLDTPPRQLLVTVRQESDLERRERSVALSGRVGGGSSRVIVPDDGPRRGGSIVLQDGDSRLRGRGLDQAARGSGQDVQTLRVLEGRRAYVQVGQSVPVRESTVRRTMVGGRVVEQVVGGTRYRNVTTGFFVVPRVSGDRVTLLIHPQQQSLDRDSPGSVNVQSMGTTVTGALGEWLEIGAIRSDASGERSMLLGRSEASGREGRRVLVKVEEVR